MQASMPNTSSEITRELKRKSLHLPGLLVPILYQQLPVLTLAGLILMSLLYYASELRRIAKRPPLPVIGYFTSRLTRSAHLDFAPMYLAIGLGLISVLFSLKEALAGALLVCLCDSLAAVVGMKFGRKNIFLTKKTYLGSLTFLMTALIVLTPWLGIKSALSIAVLSALIEAFSIEGIDNLLLPIVGALLAHYF